MGFNEKVHAFIAARFYVRLTEAFGKQGEQAFIHGTQYYAEQRGRRMAQRAIRDGMELNYATYLQYGEWVNTEETIAEGCANESEIISYAPDYTFCVRKCPWYTQFKEMGLTEAGHVYCAHLDNSICRGFNPYLTYLVPQTMHKSDCCIQSVKDAGIEEGKTYAKKAEYLKSFEYHCAHSYWSYTEVTNTIFAQKGQEISAAVLKDFAETYGQEMADTLMTYRNTNFNCID